MSGKERAIPSDPIRFRTADEFRARPQWRDELDPAEHKPVRIIGDYSLSQTDQVLCGLSPCRTKHMHGYVIETNTGFETHIGNVCGKRHFSLAWGDLQSVFDRATEDRDRKAWLTQVLADRDAKVAQARSLLNDIHDLSPKLAEVKQRIESEKLVHAAVIRVVKDGGAIRVERQVRSETAAAMGTSGSRRYLEVVGLITGLDVLGDGHGGKSAAHHSNKVRQEVVPLLLSLDRDHLNALTARNRKEVARKVEDATLSLRDGERFVARATQFLEKSNLHQLSKLDIARPNQRASRFLDHFRSLGEDHNGQ